MKEFCTFAKETADPADTDRKAVLARFDGLIERAPSEIKPDVESARDFIDATTDPEADPITKSEAALTGQEAFGRLVAYLSATCGMDIDLNSPGSPGSP